MPIDARIALGAQAPQMAQPIELYGNALKLQSMQRQNALAEQEMATAQTNQRRQAELLNFMQSAEDPYSENVQMQLPRFGQPGIDMATKLAERNRYRSETKLKQAEHEAKTLELAQSMLPAAVDDPNHYARVVEFVRSRDPAMADRMPPWSKEGVLDLMTTAKDKVQQHRMTANEQSMETDRAVTRTETGRHNLAMEQRSKVDPMQYPLLAAAVAEGRMSPDRVNSRNAAFLEQALQRNPTADLNAMAARGALMRNAGFQQKAISAEIIPEVLQNVVNAGKKLDFSDVKFIANIQKWTAGQLQDPKLTEYMTLRNDSLLSIAATMRLVGMSDYATKLEEEAAAPTMSPKQLDAWMSGQMKALNPRLKKLAGLSIDGANPAAPSGTPAANTPASAVAQVKTDADYNNLPSGTLFVDPNGEQRRKP